MQTYIYTYTHTHTQAVFNMIAIYLTMPQNPGLQIPIPPDGQISVPSLLQSTSILSATLLRSKHDEWSVDTIKNDSSPIMDHGSMFEGVLEPPASKP